MLVFPNHEWEECHLFFFLILCKYNNKLLGTPDIFFKLILIENYWDEKQ